LIRYDLDEARKVLILDLREVRRANIAMAWAIDLVQRDPGVCQCDWIIDLRGAFDDDAEASHLSRLAAVFPPVEHPAWSFLISRDPYLYLLAQAMDGLFPNRKHVVVTTPDEADLALRRVRG
jgi:hypothetical protein